MCDNKAVYGITSARWCFVHRTPDSKFFSPRCVLCGAIASRAMVDNTPTLCLRHSRATEDSAKTAKTGTKTARPTRTRTKTARPASSPAKTGTKTPDEIQSPCTRSQDSQVHTPVPKIKCMYKMCRTARLSETHQFCLIHEMAMFPESFQVASVDDCPIDIEVTLCIVCLSRIRVTNDRPKENLLYCDVHWSALNDSQPTSGA